MTPPPLPSESPGPAPSTGAVTLIGGLHLDRIAHADRRILPDTSTPARIEKRPGGVATNVAMVLARLGVPARILGCVGEDGDGTDLLDRLGALDIDLTGITRARGATATYLALHDPDGRLAAAVVDDVITAQFSPQALHRSHALLAGARIWFMDTNLRADTLDELMRLSDVRGEGAFLVADAVSMAKARRLAPILPRLDLLFANRGEAEVLVGEDGSAEQLAQALVEEGVGAVIITDGADGVVMTGGRYQPMRRPALPARTLDVTGAGDALTGGTLAGLSAGLDLAEALDYGRAAAALTLEATGAAPEGLSLAALHLRLDAAEADRLA
ncbi:PfkB family carbohydrate kinase [Breoghania sp.]|uniref:PfkB family carbohydrate kinase n=1 Tax=Breoghania sp. TaxID=2065378 RepID=UPI002AA68BED|nr:PfkB family carbohydrate kinase [Breoghania sp.]